uniref:Uncharacterized protein n=1 Tax=Anguilla anguilla TaxID=7936 RepID=A0A0E9VAU2_ANGAN
MAECLGDIVYRKDKNVSLFDKF